jgi:hypothetical protein
MAQFPSKFPFFPPSDMLFPLNDLFFSMSDLLLSMTTLNDLQEQNFKMLIKSPFCFYSGRYNVQSRGGGGNKLADASILGPIA